MKKLFYSDKNYIYIYIEYIFLKNLVRSLKCQSCKKYHISRELNFRIIHYREIAFAYLLIKSIFSLALHIYIIVTETDRAQYPNFNHSDSLIIHGVLIESCYFSKFMKSFIRCINSCIYRYCNALSKKN